MSRPPHWFQPRETDEVASRLPGIAARAPRIVEQPAGHLLIPGPSVTVARTANTDFDRGENAKTRRSFAPTAARPATLREVGVIEEIAIRGSVTLSLRHGPEPPAAPWPDTDTTGSGGAHYRPWLIQGDEIPLSRRLSHLLQPSTELLLSRNGPLEWPRPLLPYQMVGVRELISRDSLLLADDMGLGKTLEAIAALRILLVQRRIESALVVAPAGLISHWRGELRRWAPELRVSTAHGAQTDRNWQWRTPAHIYLTSYETLRADFNESPHAPVARQWDVVVLDEAQRIKNAAADVSRVCKRLHRKRQWALTGTPLENSPDDLISILEFVDPKASRELRQFMLTTGLRDHLRRVQLRRRKDEVLHDLPPKLVSAIALPLTQRQRESYDRAEHQGVAELRSYGDRLEPRNVLDVIGRLRQICNFCPRTGESSKLNDLRERLALLAAEGHKALVFTQFANAAYGARAIAARLGPSALVYTGDQSTETRDRVLELFRHDPSRTALILSLRAGGQGLNLQHASYVFHFDRWWNPAVVNQAEARSHRLGQHLPVNVYAYTAENTIEERLDRILKEKQLLFDQLVDDVSIDVPATLTSNELLGLFGLGAPTSPVDSAPPPLDPAASSTAALAERLRRTLAHRGWNAETIGSDRHNTDLLFTKRKRDTLGETTSVYARCIVQAAPVDVDAIRDLSATLRLRPGGPTRGLVVAPAGFTTDATGLAADRDITLWDETALRRLDTGDAAS